jgi:S-adenosylmethionine-diacylgycerolhomoserine-N-methlytransferase
MDAVYDAQRHIYDLTRKYYLLGRDRLIAELSPPPGGTVLEVGCGTARNLIAVARRWPRARCFGLDISEAMLATARAQVAKARLGERIVLAQGDASDFDCRALFGVADFDRVFLSYTLSMIPDWTGAIERASAALGDGGELHLVDFGQQEGLPRWWRAALFAWLDRFHVTPRGDLSDALGQAARQHGFGLTFAPLLRGYAWSGRLTAPAPR